MESKRLFLAFSLNDEFEAFIKKFIALQNNNIKWIIPENWHITVLFLGNFPDHHLPVLINSLKEFFQVETGFILEFDNFIYKPTQVKPTMIWAKLHQNSYFDLLCRRLVDYIEKLYSKLSIPFSMSLHSENVPHITLSRLKNKSVQYPEFNLKNIVSQKVILKCGKCILYLSELTPEGAKYSNLADFKLH